MRPKILLINPWVYDFAAANLWSMPLGLLKIAEYLSSYSAETGLIDCMEQYRPGRFNTGRYPKEIVKSPEPVKGIRRRYGRYGIPVDDFVAHLKRNFPVDAILVTSIMTYWYPGVFKVIELCKDVMPRTPVILGGIYATLNTGHARTYSGADHVYSGKAEQEIISVLESFGISLKKVSQPRRYFELGFYRDMAYAPLLTSQGCPYRCDYCASGSLTEGYTRKHPAATIDEIGWLKMRGVRDFAFYDDALFFRPEEGIKVILREVVDRGYDARFHTPNGVHARFIDEKLSMLLWKAGFITVRLSLETIDRKRQDETGAKVSTDELERAVRLLKSEGFTKKNIGVYILYGLPDQEIQEVWESTRFLMDLGVKVYLCEFSPIPGMAAWMKLIEKGVISDDIDPLLMNNTVYSVLYSGYSREDIERLKHTVIQYNSKP